MPRLSHPRARMEKKRALLSAVYCLILPFCVAPSAVAQGGYDTTDIAPPEEVLDHGPRPEPQEYQRKGDEDYVPGTSKYYEPKAENDVEKWFSQYDEIRRKYESSPEERQYFEQLINRPPGSGLSDDDRKFLEDMAQRYAEAFNQMKELEGITETQHLHRGYGVFASQQATMCMDYIRILSEPDARDKMGRPLAASMTEKRRGLYQLEKSNRLLDFRTRQTFNITKNPYEQRQQRE
ncbi:MAG TPA: hypothetical protein PKZ32_00075 [Candidatus Melainabacteria bacterium]|nr:hypothetical protein [Candidatus Melainabacteria bacterium]